MINDHYTTTLALEPGYLFETKKKLAIAMGLQFGGSHFTYDSQPNKWQIIPHRVAAYRFIEGQLQNGRRDYQHELPSHYGVLSTLEDLIKWDIALRNGRIINAKLLNQAFQVGELTSGKATTVWGVPYGMGWMIGNLIGVSYAEHGGFSGTQSLHFKEEDLSVIVLTNLDLRSRSNPRGIAHDLAKEVLK